ncbi:MAG: GMC family oxidoreductase [Robiginitomaculum sp.]|nr:MAG: GMC family oxidoreductase [Robiginitomaculum sp.]
MAKFDAIVIGSGMSGGWVAKELAERGLKVLILDRGKKIIPTEDFTDMKHPWELSNFDRIPMDEAKEKYAMVSKGAGYALHDSNKHFWAREDLSPYETEGETKFNWLRGYSSGGKSLLWSRQSYRLGPQDFTANLEDGHGVDWPIRYDDLKPWYEHVETFAGIAGNADGLPQLPDSVFQPPFPMNCVEKSVKAKIEAAFPTRNVIHARCAHLTEPTQEQYDLGRGKCQSRSHCNRGCSFGAYFSSVTATLPAAERTGNVTHIAYAVVDSLVYDGDTGLVSGVRVIDANTKARTTYTARMFFVSAGTIATGAILLNSTSEHFPTGIANGSGQLGRNIIDHVSGGGASGIVPGFEDEYRAGRRPAGIYIPRFSNITEDEPKFLRGFGYQGGAGRSGWTGNRAGVGEDFKRANRTPGPWRIGIGAFGEVLPREENRMYLHATKKDAYGIPVPVFDTRMSDNELHMMQRAGEAAGEMLRAAGCTDIRVRIPETIDDITPMGDRIHEMGTARMGRDPSSSVLNKWNQTHEVDNLFVTDGACMASSGCQNPSLTYMAIAARAAHHAADLLEKGLL